MRLDNAVMHSDDMGAVVGEFYGSPIREVNLLDVELREIGDAQIRARLFLGDSAPTVELLPDEAVVKGIIRKITTLEVRENNV